MKPMLASNSLCSQGPLEFLVPHYCFHSWIHSPPPIPTQHPLLVLFICLVSIFGPLLLHSDVIMVPNSFLQDPARVSASRLLDRVLIFCPSKIPPPAKPPRGSARSHHPAIPGRLWLCPHSDFSSPGFPVFSNSVRSHLLPVLAICHLFISLSFFLSFR